MGIYLNPGNRGFQMSLNSKIYVDKSGLISYTNSVIDTEQRFVCVSRPRRFGKSVTAQMLASYYGKGCDSGGQFEHLSIAGDETYRKHLNQYHVIFLNIQQFLSQSESAAVCRERLEKALLWELLEEFPDLNYFDRSSLISVLQTISASLSTGFVFIIDEWDCMFREYKNDAGAQKIYLDFMRSLFKDRSYVALAYMTGILPVKKYGTHSALNMFDEFSMADQKMLEEYTGFTQEEVKKLCEQYEMDFEEAGSWYDGYAFRGFCHICNPRSVVEAMRCRRFSSYWASTETYEALKIYIDMDFDGLREAIGQMLGGGRIRVNTNSFQNDMENFKTRDDVLTLFIHLGYLGYDCEKKEVFIPNQEIFGEFENAMSVGGWPEVMRILKASEKLLEDTLLGDEKSVAEGLDLAHMEAASILAYNDENSLACAIGLAYYSARKDYRLIRELPSGRGFADIVFLPLPASGKPALVVELKYDKTSESAIQQIKDRQYTKVLEGYAGEILLVGINYDKNKKEKPHSCRIEKWKSGGQHEENTCRRR
ncbi:MAG: AAA family ATPase [Lachnospiraceae bacterium]|nr:AAA family ATPase [Lachnospiraceae bacterium]